MDKQFDPTLYHGCNYIFLLGLESIHVRWWNPHIFEAAKYDPRNIHTVPFLFRLSILPISAMVSSSAPGTIAPVPVKQQWRISKPISRNLWIEDLGTSTMLPRIFTHSMGYLSICSNHSEYYCQLCSTKAIFRHRDYGSNLRLQPNCCLGMLPHQFWCECGVIVNPSAGK